MVDKCPHVSIIVLNWNGLEDTIECIKSMQKVDYPNFDIVVVDNGSEGNDAQILSEIFGGYIELIKNEDNYGYAGGNNVGIKYIMKNKKSKYIVTINNDTTVDENYLKHLVNFAENNINVGMIGPKIYYYYEPNVIWFTGSNANYWTCGFKNISKEIPDDGTYDLITDVDTISGCIHFMSRSMLEDIGLYDVNFPPGYDNIEICLRARSKGYRIIYLYKSVIYHKVGRSRSKISTDPKKYIDLIRFRGMAGLKARHKIFNIYSSPIHYPFQVFFLIFLTFPQMLFEISFNKRDPSTIKNTLFMLITYYKSKANKYIKK